MDYLEGMVEFKKDKTLLLESTINRHPKSMRQHHNTSTTMRKNDYRRAQLIVLYSKRSEKKESIMWMKFASR